MNPERNIIVPSPSRQREGLCLILLYRYSFGDLSMEMLQWGALFETNHELIDQQHKHIVDLTNQFGQLVSTHNFSSADFENLLEELVSYTQYHFLEEERVMADAGVDERHQQEHKAEHKTFLKDVTQLREDRHGDEDSCIRQLFEFLMNWLVYHILGSDMSMNRQMQAIKKGGLPEQAYLAEQAPAKNATDVLLFALNRLFHQVSQRNEELAEWNDALERKVAERTRALEEANRSLKEIATTDVLTGLPNRRHAMDMLDVYWQESRERERPFSCLLIDADGFKQINDNYGHDAGDTVLQELARHLKHAVRTDDLTCRLGGDEFLILCPNTGAQGALHLARQVHDQVSRLIVSANGGTWRGSISVGVATRTPSMTSPDALIKAADLAVYQAKAAGRNCVKEAGEEA